MKYTVLSLLTVSLLSAAVYEGTNEDLGIEINPDPFSVGTRLLDNPGGVNYIAPPEPLDPATLTDMNDPTSAYGYRSPVERAISYEDEGSSEWPEYDWYDDVEIYHGKVGTGQDFDVDVLTSDIYAIFDTDHMTGDSLVVYRSQDNGVTWGFFVYLLNTDGSISNPKIRVAIDASGITWVVMMGIWNEPGVDELWTKRCKPDGTSATFEQVCSDVNFADMDAGISYTSVHITYVPDGTQNVRAVRNLLDGNGWVSDCNILSPTGFTPRPAIAVGADGNVSVASITDIYSATPQVRVNRSTNWGESWNTSVPVSNSTVSAMQNVDIAYTHNHSPQTGWITVTYCLSNDNFGFYYSTDSGENWTYGSLFPGSGTDENLGNIRTEKNLNPDIDVAIAYNVDPGDSTMFSLIGSTAPSTFTTPVRINDFNATGYWPATAGWNGNSFASVLYTDWINNYRLMYDWWCNLGIDDASVVTPGMIQNAPNPFNATTNISFNLAQNSPVTISIYNIAGQLVTTLADNQSFNEGSNSVQWDGQNESGTRVSPGVYFCRLNANGISQTHRMLMVR